MHQNIVVGSLASEFLGWSWKTHVGIPTLDIGHWNSSVGIQISNVGIPTWVFQLQPKNSEAREPTNGIPTLDIEIPT